MGAETAETRHEGPPGPGTSLARILDASPLQAEDATDSGDVEHSAYVATWTSKGGTGHHRSDTAGWVEELQRRRTTSGVAVMAGAAHTVVYSGPAELARPILEACQ